MKYAHQKKIEVLVKEGVNHPDINDDHHDDKTRKRMTAWLHGSHLTDNKLLDDSINDVTVNIGKDKDWSISDYSELCKTTIDGKEYIQQTTNLFYAQGDDSGNGTKSLKIPLQKKRKGIFS
jgi:Flp pilus assembly CpaF family ATPase